MNLIEPDDFTGIFQVPRQATTDVILQAYIDRYDNRYIRQILGAELGDEFIADLSNPSQEARFAVLQDAFSMDDEGLCGKIRYSEGLVFILTGLIYYHYVTENQLRVSQSGVIRPSSETSEVLSPRAAKRMMEKKRNSVLDSIEAVQWYCTTFAPEDYPEFNGQRFSPEYSSLL